MFLRRERDRYTLYAALLGLIFPLAAFLVLRFVARDINILFAIICSAPLVLGVLARIGGIRQERLNRKNRDLEVKAREKSEAVQNLLDVSGQGFLSFGSDYRVRAEYSKECENIFGMAIAGKRIADLLYSDEARKRDFLDGFDLYFRGKARAEVLFDLMDRSITVDGKTIAVEYRAISEQQILCILTDVTESQELEQQRKLENLRRNLLVRVVTHKTYFARFVQEAATLFDRIAAHGNRIPPPAELEGLQRELHTFKGNAAFLGFQKTQDQAHLLETRIADRLILNQDFDLDGELASLRGCYFEELEIVIGTMGPEWIQEAGSVAIVKSDYLQIEKYIIRKYGQDRRLIRAIRAQRMVPLASLFTHYPEMAQELARSRGKRLQPLRIEGGQQPVIPEHYEQLADTFVHLIRNMVDHGIELPHEREQVRKPAEGRIRIQIESTDRGFQFLFADDGRGLSPARIERRAREMGYLRNGDQPTKQQLVSLIFTPGFSTAGMVSAVSGRGVGLSAVGEAVKRLRGSIAVDSEPNAGTQFKVNIPRKGAYES